MNAKIYPLEQGAISITRSPKRKRGIFMPTDTESESHPPGWASLVALLAGNSCLFGQLGDDFGVQIAFDLIACDSEGILNRSFVA